jgi:hypothetical protein
MFFVWLWFNGVQSGCDRKAWVTEVRDRRQESEHGDLGGITAIIILTCAITRKLARHAIMGR